MNTETTRFYGTAVIFVGFFTVGVALNLLPM